MKKGIRYILIGIVVTVIAVLVFLFVQKPWNREMNIVIVPETIDGFKGKIILAHISTQPSKVTMLSIEPTAQVEIIGGYGKYPLQSLYPLLIQEHKDDAFIRAAYSMTMQETIDEVWTVSDFSLINGEQPFRQMLTAALRGKIHRHGPNAMKATELLQLYRWVLLGVRSDQQEQKSSNDIQSFITQLESLHFQSVANTCSVAVVNTTGVAGIGSRVAETFQHSGFSVIRVTDDTSLSEQDKKTSSIQISSAAALACQTVLKHLPAVLPVLVSPTQNETLLNRYRSQIVVLLGTDVAEVLKKEKK